MKLSKKGQKPIQDAKQARSHVYGEQMISKWRGETEQIKTEILTLYQSRSIYKRLFDIVENNPRIQKSNALYGWLHRNYTVYASATIRRLLDNHKDVLSLENLISSICASKYLITREWFISQCPKHSRELADHWADANIGVGRNELDEGDLQKRLEDVKTLCTVVQEYVDKLVAHSDKNKPDKLPTYGDLNRAIDAVGELFKYIYGLLNQASFSTLEPVEDFYWESLFEEPWIVRTASNTHTVKARV